MPKVFLSPSTQEWNEYTGGGTEEQYMNLLADRMEPYLRASGITYVRNDPDRNVAGAIADSNAAYYDVHLALHSNAAPLNLAGKLRGIDIYYSPASYDSERLATIIANNLKAIYPLPDKSNTRPTTTLAEVTQTRAVAVLCEIGYHDNPEDAEWIRQNLTPIAANLVQSLCDYFGIPFVIPEAVQRGMVTTDGSTLHLRSYPSTDASIIAAIPNGSMLTIYGTIDNWYVVSWNGMTGYVSADYVTVG